MDLANQVKEEKHIVKNIFNRFKKRNFSGTGGQRIIILGFIWVF